MGYLYTTTRTDQNNIEDTQRNIHILGTLCWVGGIGSECRVDGC